LDISWSTDKFYLLSAFDDRTLRIWDVRSVLASLSPVAARGRFGLRACVAPRRRLRERERERERERRDEEEKWG
jgi:hypothetical protein